METGGNQKEHVMIKYRGETKFFKTLCDGEKYLTVHGFLIWERISDTGVLKSKKGNIVEGRKKKKNNDTAEEEKPEFFALDKNFLERMMVNDKLEGLEITIPAPQSKETDQIEKVFLGVNLKRETGPFWSQDSKRQWLDGYLQRHVEHNIYARTDLEGLLAGIPNRDVAEEYIAKFLNEIKCSLTSVGQIQEACQKGEFVILEFHGWDNMYKYFHEEEVQKKSESKVPPFYRTVNRRSFEKSPYGESLENFIPFIMTRKKLKSKIKAEIPIAVSQTKGSSQGF